MICAGPPTVPAPPSESSADRRASVREPVLAFLATTAVATVLYWTSRGVPILRDNLHAFIAVLFYYAPAVASRWARRPFDYREAGLTVRPLGTNAAVLAGAVALTLPLFVGGFFLFYDVVCAAPAHGLPAALAGLCPGTWHGNWHDRSGGHWRLPSHFLLLAANQAVVVALPEEVFFRGYLLQRLEARFPPTRRLAGAPVGVALLLSAVLFALGHVLVDFNPQRLAVFFPALIFGWMRARTGSLAAGAAFHASCNLLSDILHTSFF